MKILILTHELPPVGGGGGQVALDLSREFVKHGHSVVILTAHFGQLKFKETNDGITIIRLPSLRRKIYKTGFFEMGLFVFSTIVYGMFFIPKWKPNLIHVHFAVPAGAAAWTLSKIYNIPYILTSHLGDVPGGTPDKTRHWFKWVFPFTHRIWRDARFVTAVSSFTKSIALKYYPVEINVIPNGISMVSPKDEVVKDHYPPRLIFAGRFVHQKNIFAIINTLAKISNLQWECLFVGDGPLRNEIELKINELGLNNRITLTGWVAHEQVIEYLNKSDILFMPSFSEGLPIVGVNALVNGLAIVASNIGGFIDIVEQGKNGFLVNPFSEQIMADYLTRLLLEPEALGSAQAYSRYFSKNFEINTVAERYLKLFDKTISEY